MNNTYKKEIKKVVSSMHMGNLLFKSYINKTNNEKLKKELLLVLDRFESHLNKLKIVSRKYYVDNIDKLSFRQEMTLNLQLMKRQIL